MLINQRHSRFHTFWDVKVLVHQEEDPKYGQPGDVANQNMRCPWLGEEQWWLTRPQEHGCHYGHRRQDVTVTEALGGKVFVKIVYGHIYPEMYLNADWPAMISVTEPTPQWAQLKIYLLDRDTNNTNILLYCNNNIKYKCK